jgi:mycothiol system anti-sigma-R factor
MNMVRRTVNCEEVLRHLFAYIDQELDAEASAEIERHIELCRGCFSRVEFERRLKAMARETASAEAPERLHRRLKALIDSF